jgi:hypothetical protein
VITDEQLANAAATYFGGRARALHVLECDRCEIAPGGQHVICPNHPDKRHAPQLVRK